MSPTGFCMGCDIEVTPTPHTMKYFITVFSVVAAFAALTCCSSGPRATTGTAVGAVGGTVVAGPVGGVAGAVAGNAIGRAEDREARRR